MAISTLAAVLEQKVWIKTGKGTLYPNLYVTLIGHPGMNKTVTIRRARRYLQEVPEFHFAPTSVTTASLIDSLVDAKRTIIQLPDPPLEYNTMMIAADELGTFIHKYDDEMIAVLSAFYDPDPYGQNRRGKEIKIKIKQPQLNILCGSTPSNLMKFMPEGAWDQGFCSRMIFVFSDERIVGDDFGTTPGQLSDDLLMDLKIINSQVGEYKVTQEYRDLVNAWRAADESFPDAPKPTHPKLTHYNTRRRAHFYKLSMIAAMDRSNTLLLTREDFNRAMGWLVEVEAYMADIFKAGAGGGDSAAMDELFHFILMSGKTNGILETAVVREAAKYVPAHSVARIVENMVRAGMIEASQPNPRTGMRTFHAKAT